MNANGWRRATVYPTDWTDVDDPAYSYGFCEAGDIIGPWLIADLQMAMTPLKWTASSVGADVANFPNGRAKTIDQSDGDCATSLANSQTNWNATAFSASTPVATYSVSRFSDGGSVVNTNRYQSWLKTGREDWVVGAPGCNFNWNVYYVADGGGLTFVDIDSLGLVEGKYYGNQTGGPSATWDVSTGTYSAGGPTGWPPGLGASPFVCPVAFRNEAAYFHDARWIYKWVFTNA
jgi:hypothetical protein